MAQCYEIEHMVLEAEEVGSDALVERLGRLNKPFVTRAFVPTYALSELTQRHVKVALSNDGQLQALLMPTPPASSSNNIGKQRWPSSKCSHISRTPG